MKITIREDERGLLFRDDAYKRLLEPGTHRIFPAAGRAVQVFNTREAFQPDRNINVFLADPDIRKIMDIVDVKDDEIALHYRDGHFSGILGPGRHAFWKVFVAHEFMLVDKSAPLVAPDINPAVFSNDPALWSEHLHEFEVPAHGKALLYFNGVLERVLEPGMHRYWKGPIKVAAGFVDLRRQQLEMIGQDLMTADRVSIRVNFTCHYKVIDPVRVVNEIKEHEKQLYVLLQLVLREYLGTLKLDEILERKEALSDFVLSRMKEREGELGVEFVFAGLKDIVLPGEIKDILNMVIAAEKKAQANIITRREETASTRSLLNTARLMEENPTLYRLKELEYLEKLSEKIGNVSLMGSGTLMEQLSAMLGSSGSATAGPRGKPGY